MESSGQAAEAIKDVQDVKEAADTEIPVLRNKLGEYINDSRTRETLIGAVQVMNFSTHMLYYG